VGGPLEQVTVVGDLHGQVPDLLCLLRLADLPSPHHRIVFNGDFVDRGDNGCEVFVRFQCVFSTTQKRRFK
jgi:hypothetical protein